MFSKRLQNHQSGKLQRERTKLAYLARFPAMGGKLDGKTMQRVRFEYDDNGKVDGITAYKKDKMERFLKVVNALQRHNLSKKFSTFHARKNKTKSS